MKISESWLREWVNPALDTQALAHQLTMAGLEVEAIVPVAGAFHNVVVAKVLETHRHPQADRLTVCAVDAGEGEVLQVVCGAPNVRAGLMVALAKIGAHLPGDFVIKEAKLRGELSQGMLCAASELGLMTQEEGIMELAEDAPLGADLREYLNLDDHIFDLNITPNRADCLSILGVAREVAALNQLPLLRQIAIKNVPDIDTKTTIHLNAPRSCPNYAGRFLTNINCHATTPLYIQERLKRADIRPTHPVVDVLHYVMLELGQPMHAFDKRAIQGNICIRQASVEDSLTLLNEQEVQLDPEVLVIADAGQVLAMAGIMGGQRSAVQSDTQAIWLESAFFEPMAISGIARRYGLLTEASHRYERGVDPHLNIFALEVATALLHQIVGGNIGPIVQSTAEHFSASPISISFRPTLVKRLTGMDIAETQMQTILEHLGMQVRSAPSMWTVLVPSFRFDLRLEVDLVEEIIRLVGYDEIPAKPSATVMRPGTIAATEQLCAQIMTFLVHRGYRETISYSFVDPELQQLLYPNTKAKQLLNPISSELSVMRIGLWPGLLASMLHNIHRQQPALKLCETGKIFVVTENGVEEKTCCAGLITGEHGQFNWADHAALYDFFDMKGDLQALFDNLQYHDIRFVPGEHSALHPGKTAQIMYGDMHIGWIGALHPRLLDMLDVTADVIVFEFKTALLQDKPPVKYCAISKYPQIRRDLSLLVDTHISAAQLEAVVRNTISPTILKSCYIFDVYTGGNLADEGKKSVAMGMILQSDDHTLVDTEIHP
ncbi:MAG TPA: phenylalanine--tRNA ligase subunit beta, partial [Legionellaceae bacterium]|nr:phenylalanine--tRNA ligase subunit beta [Legionellaceae bacterium]